MKNSKKYRFMVMAILLVAMVCLMSGCGEGKGETNNYYVLSDEQFNQLLEQVSKNTQTTVDNTDPTVPEEGANVEIQEEEEDEGLMHVNASYLEYSSEVIYFFHSADEAKNNVLDLKWDDCKIADIRFEVTVNSEVKNVKFSPDNYQNTIPLVVDVDNGIYGFNTGKIQQNTVYCINFQINDATYYFCIKF